MKHLSGSGSGFGSGCGSASGSGTGSGLLTLLDMTNYDALLHNTMTKLTRHDNYICGFMDFLLSRILRCCTVLLLISIPWLHILDFDSESTAEHWKRYYFNCCSFAGKMMISQYKFCSCSFNIHFSWINPIAIWLQGHCSNDLSQLFLLIVIYYASSFFVPSQVKSYEVCSPKTGSYK